MSRICTQRPTPYFIKHSFRICASSFDHPGEGVKFHLRIASVTELIELLSVSPSAALVRFVAKVWHAYREAASPTLGPRLVSASRADISLALCSSTAWLSHLACQRLVRETQVKIVSSSKRADELSPFKFKVWHPSHANLQSWAKVDQFVLTNSWQTCRPALQVFASNDTDISLFQNKTH